MSKRITRLTSIHRLLTCVHRLLTCVHHLLTCIERLLTSSEWLLACIKSLLGLRKLSGAVMRRARESILLLAEGLLRIAAKTSSSEILLYRLLHLRLAKRISVPKITTVLDLLLLPILHEQIGLLWQYAGLLQLLLLLKVRPYTKIRYLLLWRRRSHVLLILLDRVKEIYQVWSRTLRLWFRGYCWRGF